VANPLRTLAIRAAAARRFAIENGLWAGMSAGFTSGLRAKLSLGLVHLAGDGREEAFEDLRRRRDNRTRKVRVLMIALAIFAVVANCVMSSTASGGSASVAPALDRGNISATCAGRSTSNWSIPLG